MSRDIREVIREEPLVRDRLLGLLRGGPRTVPELAASGLPASEVMTWMMSMRKYGYVAEQDAAGDGYYLYAAVSKP
jgi:DNA-binding IclR family transcriptional regulator